MGRAHGAFDLGIPILGSRVGPGAQSGGYAAGPGLSPRRVERLGIQVAFGVELSPHPDFTAMALLALRGFAHAGQPLVHTSLDYLATRFDAAQSTYSLAWAVIALSAYGHEGAHRLRQQLEKTVITQADIGLTRVLALAALALEDPPYTFQAVIP